MKMILMTCPICGSDNIDKIDSDWYGEGYLDIIWSCLDCGSGWTDRYDLVFSKCRELVDSDGKPISVEGTRKQV